MRSLLRYLLLMLFLFTISLYPKVRHIYEADGAQAIQDSIDVSDAGDTVMVHNGKYYIGDLSDPTGIQLQGKRLMSVSPDSAPYCTLSGLSSSGLDTAFNVITDSLIESCSSVIQGLTVTNGLVNSVFEAGGINIVFENNAVVLIQDNIITRNLGGGISQVQGGNSVIENNLIKENKGPGIITYNFPESVRIIRNNIIKCNINLKSSWPGGYGGGIFLESGLAINFSVVENDLKQKGVLDIIENNLIMNNYAKYGGGIAFGYSIGGKINGNLIFSNRAKYLGGGIYCEGGSLVNSEKISGSNNIITSNRANEGGTIFTMADNTSLEGTFAVDNGAVQNNSGLLYHSRYSPYDSPNFVMRNSNIYYNTYQKDKEVFIDPYADITCILQDNFWWLTDSAFIDSLISGSADFIPFEPWFVDSVPGEPTDIYSVLNYNSDYSTIIDSLGGDPDTLYLEITGHDRNSQFQEAAVAILKSNIYPTGIAVALLETDSASGIYRWKGVVKTTSPPDSIRIDDINQTIRVDPDGDTIKIIANMDNSEIFKVYYRCQGGMEGDSPDGFVIQPLQNPVVNKPEFRFFLPEESEVKLSLYDVSGRMIDDIISEKLSSGWHTAQGEVDLPGVYIYRIESGNNKKSGKVVVVR